MISINQRLQATMTHGVTSEERNCLSNQLWSDFLKEKLLQIRDRIVCKEMAWLTIEKKMKKPYSSFVTRVTNKPDSSQNWIFLFTVRTEMSLSINIRRRQQSSEHFHPINSVFFPLLNFNVKNANKKIGQA